MGKNASFLRWAGGKTWLVPFVEETTRDLGFNNYFEPFMGGASIFFSLDIRGNAYLSDINAELVNAFCSVRDNPRYLVNMLSNMETDRDSYYQIRESRPRGRHQRAARFIYLNATCFNGLYRVNKRGDFNVPYGNKETINLNKITELSGKLQGVSIVQQDFFSIRDQIQANDLVFLDPPYVVSRDNDDNGFIEYNSILFSLDDQYRLRELIEHIDEVGAYYILTNAAHDVILEIFGNRGRMTILERNSFIGGREAFRGNIQEYIFTNIPERG